MKKVLADDSSESMDLLYLNLVEEHEKTKSIFHVLNVLPVYYMANSALRMMEVQELFVEWTKGTATAE